jgi:hypothetical protein
MLTGATAMEFGSRSKEVALADLTRKRDQLPSAHLNRRVLDRMIADLNADLGRQDGVERAPGVAIIES